MLVADEVVKIHCRKVRNADKRLIGIVPAKGCIGSNVTIAVFLIVRQQGMFIIFWRGSVL